MAPDPSIPRGSDGRSPGGAPLAGMRWSLESPEDHAARHDSEQVRYWLSQPPSERLAQAERYRVRVLGGGPYALARTFALLPSVVSTEDV